MKGRRVTGVVSIALSAILLGAAMGQAVQAKKTTIQYMCWVVGDEDIKAYKKIVDAFEKKNPDIVVKLNPVWWPGEAAYLSKLLTMTVANIAPDVIAIPFHDFPAVAESNIITEITPYLAGDKDVSLSSWFPVGITSSKWKGKLMGLPTFGSSWWVHYNRRAFAESGLVEPEQLYQDGQWTMDVMAEDAVKTTKWSTAGKMDRIGILTYHDVIAMNSWIRGMGGEFYDEAKGVCTMDSPPVIKAYEMVSDLVFAKKAMSLANAPPYNTDHGSFAKQGKFAMMAWWDSMAGQIRGMKITWPLNTVPFPKGPVRSDNINAQIHVLTMSRQSKSKTAAWTFMKFMAGTEGSSILGRDVQWLTTCKGAEDAYKAGHLTTNSTGIRFLDDALERTTPDPRSRRMSDLLPKIQDATMKIWAGTVDVTTGLREAAKIVNGATSSKK